MPYTRRRRAPVRKTRKVTTRKYNNKKKIYRKRYNRVPRSITTMANIPSMQKLRYVTTVLLSNSGGGSKAYYQFRTNSLHDPDYTSTGHQPCRYDQLSQFYAKYCVVGAKITVRHVGGWGTNKTPFILACYLDDDATPPTDITAMIENGKCKYRLVNGDAGHGQTKLVQYFSAKKFFNITNIKDNDQISALTNASPADVAIFNVCAQANDGSSAFDASLLVTIDYLAIFQEPIDLAQS